MALEVTLHNTALDAIVARINDISLHSDDPGSTGANELPGGGTYERETPAWDAAAASEVVTTNPLVFQIAAGNVVEYVGFWEGATFVGSGALSAPEPFNNDGELTIQTITITAANV